MACERAGLCHVLTHMCEVREQFSGVCSCLPQCAPGIQQGPLGLYNKFFKHKAFDQLPFPSALEYAICKIVSFEQMHIIMKWV